MTKPKTWSRVLLSLLATSLLFTACKKEYSKDETLPAVYSPSIIVGSDNQVIYALNPANGDKNWELAMSSPIIASPIVYGGMAYIANSTRDSIYKVNAKTGEVVQRITFSGGGAGVTATPIADGNLLYVASLDGAIYAIDTGSYTTKWSYNPNTGGIQSSPTIYNGKLYFATTGGHIYSVDKTSGPNTSTGVPLPVWDYPGLGNVATAKFVSSPTIAAPYLYIGGANDSNMYCIFLDTTVRGVHMPTFPDTGVARWIYKAQGNIVSSPAAYGGNCIFGCNDFRVYCLDSIIDPLMGIMTPTPRWIAQLTSEVASSPYAVNQVVYIGCKDYQLYALNILNGAQRWAFSTSGVITSSPLVYNGTIYIGSYDKFLYAVDSARGTLKWSKNINGQIQCSPVIDNFTSLTGFNSQVSGYTN